MRILLLSLSCILAVSAVSAQVTMKQKPAVKSTASVSASSVVINESAKNDVTLIFDKLKQQIAETYKELMGNVRTKGEALEQKALMLVQQSNALKAQADKIDKTDIDADKKKKNIQSQIDKLESQRSVIMKQMSALNDQIEKLETDQQAALADLNKKEQKSVQEASAAKSRPATEYQAVLKNIESRNGKLVEDKLKVAKGGA